MPLLAEVETENLLLEIEEQDSFSLEKLFWRKTFLQS